MLFAGVTVQVRAVGGTAACGRAAPGSSPGYRARVRWESLFDDLEAQLAAAEVAERDAELAERTRSAWARTALADRLRATQGQRLDLALDGGERVSGVCRDVAVEWVALATDTGAALVPLHAVAWVQGVGRAVAPPPGQVLRRLGLASALRALARDRAVVRLLTGGGEVSGTIDRVGADHLDVASHPVGEARRAEAVRSVVTVPFAALRVVRGAPG